MTVCLPSSAWSPIDGHILPAGCVLGFPRVTIQGDTWLLWRVFYFLRLDPAGYKIVTSALLPFKSGYTQGQQQKTDHALPPPSNAECNFGDRFLSYLEKIQDNSWKLPMFTFL